ncbi:1349_t:CDS:2 [Ambispora leptoticha]|uniref:1349_t:CDS:1 n=1 Tax=Ambispora leptoticha TaxID=144679 RepID=A0A9N9EEH9_9GLOM|nr:1349_t:CDS:2 [Ambispora leptoticha]
MQSFSLIDSFSLGFGPIFFKTSKEIIELPSGRSDCSGSVKTKRTMQEPGLKAVDSKNKMVKFLLRQADTLVFRAINVGYKLADISAKVQEFLGAISCMYKSKKFINPVEDFRIKERYSTSGGGFSYYEETRELYKLRFGDVQRRSGMLWIRIRKVKNDPFANGKFVLIELTGRWRNVSVCGFISNKTYGGSCEAAGRFSSHSLRIEGATELWERECL